MTDTSHTETVETPAGRVRGIWRGDSAAFLGIPFAEPPTGERRFAPPVRRGDWDGVLDATAPGSTPQRRPFSETPTIPEPTVPGDDTLNVNVFTPAPGDRDAKLPVFVWIHGGAYLSGTPSSPWYDGRAFNRDGVVTVAVSYRLGFDGFGWTGQHGSGGDSGLNRGFLDQVTALEWVQDNIASFGGDPDRVTIGGQSAGGTSVLQLLASPRAQGLFHGVIAQSAAINDIDADEVARASRMLADSLGIPPTLDGWRSLTEDQILDVERVGKAYGGVSLFDPPKPIDLAAAVQGMRAGMPVPLSLEWAPAIDGEVLTAPVSEGLASGQGAEVPLLIGRARNEFPVPSPRPRADVVSDLRDAGLSDAALERFGAEIDLIGDQFAQGQAVTEMMFAAGALRTADAHRRAGGSAGTWLYDFNGRIERGNLSPHCSDVPYSFDLLDAPGVGQVLGSSPSQELADAMHGDWVRFITDGGLDWPTVEDAGLQQARVYDADGSHLDPASYVVTAGVAGME